MFNTFLGIYHGTHQRYRGLFYLQIEDKIRMDNFCSRDNIFGDMIACLAKYHLFISITPRPLHLGFSGWLPGSFLF